MSDRPRSNLRARLAKKELLVALGVFDGISTKIADSGDVRFHDGFLRQSRHPDEGHPDL